MAQKWYGLSYLRERFTRYWGLKLKVKSWLSIFSHFLWFSNLDISGTTHPIILNHTIFQASFSRSFQWCNSFLYLNTFKNCYFLAYRALTNTLTLKPLQKKCACVNFGKLFFMSLHILKDIKNTTFASLPISSRLSTFYS